MLEIVGMKDIKDATPEELENLRKNGFLPEDVPARGMTPYERTRAKAMATGNQWAKENFNATHN